MATVSVEGANPQNFQTVLEDLTEFGKKLYQERKFKEVENMYSSFIKELEEDKPDDMTTNLKARAFNNRGHAKYMQVDFDKAKEDYSVAIDLDPDLGVAFYNRATIFYRMGNMKEALEDFEIACQKDPTNEEFQEGKRKCQESN